MQPILDPGRAGIVMLADACLATAQTLVDAGWVSVGAATDEDERVEVATSSSSVPTNS
jgi:hypothetical protein